MAKKRMAKEWSTVVERWQRSGLTAKEFAATEGLVASTLSWWRWHLGSKERASRKERMAKKRAPKKAGRVAKKRAPKKAGRMATGRVRKKRVGDGGGRDQVPVRLVELVARGAAVAKETPLELVFGPDVVVRVRRGFDPETLRRLLAVFGGEDTARC